MNEKIVDLEFQTEPVVEKTLLVPLLTFNEFRKVSLAVQQTSYVILWERVASFWNHRDTNPKNREKILYAFRVALPILSTNMRLTVHRCRESALLCKF